MDTTGGLHRPDRVQAWQMVPFNRVTSSLVEFLVKGILRRGFQGW